MRRITALIAAFYGVISSRNGVSGDAHYGAGDADKLWGAGILATVALTALTLALTVTIPIWGTALLITVAAAGMFMLISGAFEQDAAEKEEPPVHLRSTGDGYLDGRPPAFFGPIGDPGAMTYQDCNAQTGQWTSGVYPGPPHGEVGINPNPHY